MDNNEEPFDDLLARLEPELADSTARYKQLRSKLIKYFQWNRCGDPESLADETITRALKTVIKGTEIRADNRYYFIYAIAKNVRNEYIRREIKDRNLLDNFHEPTVELKDAEDCYVECLLNLPADKLKLLHEYFLDKRNSEQLAEELGITINALRLQIHRLKKALETCFEDCRKKLSES